ncbi:hypothetical protein CNR22_01850 [Sphingobacteriaceae bacterium]|nr:hypothetical protein CNR22_01850 [Sphingobacteriaceae bacterium]
MQIDSANSVLSDLKKYSFKSGIEVEVINQQLLVKTEQVKSKSDSLKGLIKANLAKLDSLAP